MIKHLLSLLFLLLSSALAADIGITPPRLELSGRPGETVSATVTVLTTAPAEQQIATELSDWSLDPEGDIVFLPASSFIYSASDWLNLDMTDFILESSGSQEVRVSLSIPADTALEGTYQSMVFFTVVPVQTETSGVGVLTTTRIGLAVYLTITGTEAPELELLDFYQEDDNSLSLAILNLGNTMSRLSGVVELRDETGAMKYRLEVPDVPVLRDSERELRLEFPEALESGFYVALALVQESYGGLMVGELNLQVP